VVRGQELLTFVVYDIEDDRVRARIASACKDYGLERIQYSAFCGQLDSTRRS
jgi:CRISPR-associated protein Cas2